MKQSKKRKKERKYIKLPRMKRNATKNPLLKKVSYMLHRLPLEEMPNLNVNTIAARVGVTPGHLSRVLKENFGFTLKGALVEIKMVHARKLLIKGAPIKEIAYLLDFSSTSYFTRVFKSYYGVTPGTYRKHLDFFLLLRQMKPKR
jgi:AraC-like DNA-binding protein